MARRTSAYRELQALILQFTPTIRDSFLDAIQNLRDQAIIKEITKAIAEGDVNRAIFSLGLDDVAFRGMVRTVEDAFEAGGVATGRTFPRILKTPIGQTVFRFDVRNSRAEAWLRDRSSTKITGEILEKTRAGVRSALQRGMAEGHNPTRTALDIVGRVNPATGRREGGMLGLTSHQEGWVSKVRGSLENLDKSYFNYSLRDKRFDSLVEKAIRDGKPLSKADIERLTSRYKDKVLKYRGDVIGRTESIAALNRSEHEAIQQAVDIGALKESQIKRVWDSVGNDGHTRDSHLAMEGQTVGLNEPFTFPGGSQAMFPGDVSLGAPGEETVQCRCIARTVIDWLADARSAISDEDRAALLGLSDDELFGGR